MQMLRGFFKKMTIGDFYYYNSTLIRIDGVIKQGVNPVYDEDDGFLTVIDWIPISDLKPVVITPRILKALSFEENNGEFHYLYWTNAELVITFNQIKKVYEVTVNRIDRDLNGIVTRTTVTNRCEDVNYLRRIAEVFDINNIPFDNLINL